MKGDLPTGADVVIVGAGSAGCVLAQELARSGSRSVLLLEQGPEAAVGEWSGGLDTLPIGPGSTIANRYSERRGRPVVRGTGVGGSSSVNGGYFMRWHRADLELFPGDWAADLVAAYDALDGGELRPASAAAPETDPRSRGLMSVSAFGDDELGDVPRAFEAYWSTRFGAPNVGAWPVVGVNRVRSNRRFVHSAGWQRFTAADVMSPAGSVNLTVLGGRHVRGLARRGDRIVGVVVGEDVVAAGEVVLCAGTLGTAALLQSERLVPARLPLYEHPERIVRFAPRGRVEAAALLQSVVHADDGVEIRCYSDDFAEFIDGVPRLGVPVGIADMANPTLGEIGAGGLDLGTPSAASQARMDDWVSAVVAMLAGPDFAHLVTPGSVTADPSISMSQHASGTLRVGREVDGDGVLAGVRGLRVVDASILPPGGRSGPHETVTAVARMIGRRLAGRD